MRRCLECNEINNRQRSKFCCSSCRERFRWKNMSQEQRDIRRKRNKINNKRRRDNFTEEEFHQYREYKRKLQLKWSKQNKDKIILAKKKWKENNSNHNKIRYKNDIQYKIRSVLRSRLNIALKNNQKTGSAIKDLGCNIKDFKKYIECKWQSGMTWDNWSKDGWHLDHIVPLSSFDLSDREQLKKACHYSNLQPMWAKDNLSKGDTDGQ